MENQTLLNDTSGSSEWQNHISSMYAELAHDIAETGLRHFEEIHTITTDGGGEYPLPSDFLSSVGVDYKVNAAGQRRGLAELMVQERNVYRGVTGASEARTYSIVGGSGTSGARPLTLYPTPPSGQTYELIYIPQPEDLSTLSGNTLVDVVTAHGEEFILWGAAFRALTKEDTEAQVYRFERDAYRAKVIEWATLRALNQPRRRIVDEEIDGFADGDWWRGFY
jgi:hypothetical protein